MLHIQYLMDTVTGLWFHGWEFTPEKVTVGHNFAKALWARGNCWITISIPLFIELLAEDAKKHGRTFDEQDPLRRFLVSTFKKQVDALLRVQERESGMWNTLLVDRESYVETSATAGFAAGIYMGLRLVRSDIVGSCHRLVTHLSLPTVAGPDSRRKVLAMRRCRVTGGDQQHPS
jgi:unsaturated rhamnogalacturonyl hydrolase